MWCVCSALLFGAVAFITQGTWLSPAFASLMVSSIAYHGTTDMEYPGKSFVAFVDKTLAYAITATCVYNAIGVPITPPMLLFWCGFCYMAYIYHISKLSHHPEQGNMWHSTLHIGASLGAIGLYFGKYQPSTNYAAI